ncbi:hypothetical protein SDC9_132529 [bioreactor metagenome]|uniref:Uncharacterized protein n=1 Tax=bioreactor metagenome TaxID=1076179 RepID=A0A645D8R3_9ZZZZ
MGLISNQIALDLLLKLKQKIKDKRDQKKAAGKQQCTENPQK